MDKEQIQNWLDNGYDILHHGRPVKVEGNLWDYIDGLGSYENVFVLRELIYWTEEELANIGKQ
ncbi:hypothetical protein OHD16_14835 [Sphingobacterium sp. ML3W]|jgi:hypothetical protein|uniref:Uncharacterized protein n=2 Tax=Sphingobacterium TaxID=28453 RepID=A0A420BHV1_SPHD1|nr:MULTISPECIES: hypothetical protein [Sphingobacterium]MCS4224363.1 hypothetical protein [Sphingobacterium sp. BIGb0165]RKE56236.1 hypothetical protein DFQ12_1089 [Sphingobacterium detergens]ULT24608.1 hypothetical protein KUH03_37685 [Sphingobacterium sp. E70]WFA81233.1 hypothetical protein OGI71_07980 [Sphingobacterium sp. ML3W]